MSIPCFKDWREWLEEVEGLSWYEAWARSAEEGEKVCMLAVGHTGDHRFVNDTEVDLVYVGHDREGFFVW